MCIQRCPCCGNEKLLIEKGNLVVLQIEGENWGRMIFVDNRGSDEAEIAEILERKHYPVTRQHVDSGDYIIGELGIERKTVQDLLNSIIPKVEQKGHTFLEQIKVMKDTYKKVIVIVEGYIDWS